MLFDLRGRGRRRTVRVIYSGLALLMGGGLVLFGVGSFGGTGILNNIGNETSGGASFAGKIKKYQQLTHAQPKNPAAWEKLAEAQLGEAGSSEAYVTTNGITAKGKELYEQVAQTWASYQALHPVKPSVKLAKLMFRVFGEEGLNKPGEAVSVLQIIVAAEPSSPAYFVALAKSAYLAHDLRVGDLAAKKAVSLVPAIEQPRIRSELAGLRTPTTSGTGTTLTATKGPNGRLTIPSPAP